MFESLKSLFSKKRTNLSSFQPIKVDIHSHLIANIDDGVKSIDEAIAIIQEMKSLGYEKIITTPHTMRGGYDNTKTTILSGYNDLKEELKNRNIKFEIEVASEYYLDETFVDLIKNKENILTFGNNFLLFEMSYLTKPNNMESTIFDMNILNYKAVLAHPERYPYLYTEDLEKYKQIKEKNVLFQINLFSLVGYYGKSAKKFAEKLIDSEMVDFIGTDIHNTTQLSVLKSCLRSEYVEKILNSKKIKNNIL